MGQIKKFNFFFNFFWVGGPQGHLKFFQKIQLWMFLTSFWWSYWYILIALESMVLQVKKSPKKDGKWLSYRNFSIVKSEIYISKKFAPPKKDQFSILKFKFHNEKFMFELFKWYFQNQKTKEIKIMQKNHIFNFIWQSSF